jgi:hypothetical protein
MQQVDPGGDPEQGIWLPNDLSTNKPSTVDAPTLAKLTAGTTRLYVFGYVAYRDDYSWLAGSKIVNFCFRYLPLAGLPLVSDGPSFGSCVSREAVPTEKTRPRKK